MKTRAIVILSGTVLAVAACHSLALPPNALADILVIEPAAIKPRTGLEPVSRIDIALLRMSYTSCQPTRSVGRPWKGRLECGVLPEPHARFTPMSWHLFGTRQTQRALRQAADRLEVLDPGGPSVELFDISTTTGGPSRYHLSHQSGRDVDLGYIYVSGWHPGPGYDVPTEKIDADRTWLFLKALIDTGDVQRVFIDHGHQAALREAAERAGAKRLNEIFQYPRPPEKRVGIVRHYANHRWHLHVRFRCPKKHRRCKA